MFRPARLRVPAALTVAGALLLSACAVAGTSATGGPSAGPPQSLATSTVAAASPAPATPVPTTAASPPPTTPEAPSAPPTLVYRPTASTWADLVVGGTVTTSAAAPSITPTAIARAQAAGRGPARTLRPSRAAAPKTVYLTFDDGPSPKYTRQVLALLKEYDAKATFFVIGRQVHGSGARLVRAEYAAGHGVGNHTWDHHSLRHMKAKAFAREIGRTQKAITKATGHASTCLRPPGGSVDKNTRKRAKKADLKVAMWTVDPDDWRNPKAKTIAARVLRATHDGSIVLMHDGGGNRARSIAALRIVLATLHARGYTFAAMCR